MHGVRRMELSRSQSVLRLGLPVHWSPFVGGNKTRSRASAIVCRELPRHLVVRQHGEFSASQCSCQRYLAAPATRCPVNTCSVQLVMFVLTDEYIRW